MLANYHRTLRAGRELWGSCRTLPKYVSKHLFWPSDLTLSPYHIFLCTSFSLSKNSGDNSTYLFFCFLVFLTTYILCPQTAHPASEPHHLVQPRPGGQRGQVGRDRRARPSPPACGEPRPRRGRALRPLGQVSQQLSPSPSPQRHRGPTAPQGRPAPSPRARGPEAAAAPTLLFTSMVPRPRLPAAPPR